MNPAAKPHPRIWGSPQDYIESGPVLGRKVANASFLQALLEADPYDEYHFFPSHAEGCNALTLWLQERFPALMRRGAVYIAERVRLQDSLTGTRYHCMHLPDPFTFYTPLMQARNAFAPELFPITGLTHSLSYAGYMQKFLEHLWPGVTRRDGLIVTSASAETVVQRAYDALRRNYALDAQAFPAPGLYRLPLGVAEAQLPGPDESYDAKGGAAAREMRGRLDIGDEPVFLCFSRFCHQSKMDLMPLFSAFRRAESLGLPRNGYTLVMAGWAEEGDTLPASLRALAEGYGIRTRLLERPTALEKKALFAMADVFVSPSDNIQETFGLTVVEAALSGLPAVVSDFDGYRDTVVHGETGLLTPTFGFAQSDEIDVQALLWFDNQYHLKLAQETAVLTPALAGALAELGTDKALRRKMGEAARERARDLYAWDRVLRRWVELWDRLASTSLTPEEEERARQARHPQMMRYAEVFGGHFTARLGGAGPGGPFAAANGREAAQGAAAPGGVLQGRDPLLIRTTLGDALYRNDLPLVRYAGMEFMLDPEAVRLLLFAARKPVATSAALRRLEAHFAARDPAWAAGERAAFLLLWAVKQDYLEPLI